MNSLEPFGACLLWKAEVLKSHELCWGLEASVHTVVCLRGRFKGSPDLFLRVFHVPFEEVGVHSLVTIINIPLRMLLFPLRLLRKQVERQFVIPLSLRQSLSEHLVCPWCLPGLSPVWTIAGHWMEALIFVTASRA